MAQPNRIDPDISADFSSNAPVATSSNVRIDPDVAADFRDSPDDKGKSTKRVGWAEENLAGPSEVIGSTLANIPHAVAHGAVDLYRRFTGGDTDAPDPEAVRAIQVPMGEGGKQLLSDTGALLNPRHDPDVWDRTQTFRDKMLGPQSATVSNVLEHMGEVASDVGAIAAPAAIVKGALTKAPISSALEAPHPLQGMADAESARISQAVQRGRAAGMDLPDRQISPTQGAANQIVRQEFDMPDRAPITPKMLDAVRRNNYAPGYQAVEKIPKVQLGSAYEDDIGNVDLSAIKDKYQPPPGGSMTGERAVELSKYLREKGSAYFQEGTVEGTEKGQAHWDAAQAVEDAVERRLKATGQAQTATDWDNARVGYAKTYSVQSALDGAGNVVVPKLKSQLIRGKPLSGGLEDLATMGAVNPEAFRGAPQAPKPGLLRRFGAHSAPIVGGAIGGAVGGSLGVPSIGAASGVALGKNIGEGILGQ
jgi:hypothetical protein